MAAYSGKFVTWDEMLTSSLKIVPETFEFGPVPDVKEEFPLPGVEYKL